MGELFALLSAVAFGLSTIYINKGIRREDNGAFLSMLITAAVGGAAVLGHGFARGFTPINRAGVLWFVFGGVFTSFLGRQLLYVSIEYLGAIRAAAVKRLNPFFAVIVGVLFLRERLSAMLIAGMALIFVSFALLVRQSLAAEPAMAAGGKAEGRAHRRRPHLGYLYGPLSAAAYAFGYVGRKAGLALIPDPFFGAMVSGLVGSSVYLCLAPFDSRYRSSVRSTFTRFSGFLFLGGLTSSLGQLFYFLALKYTLLSRVALLSSLEVFVTLFVSMWLIGGRGTVSREVWLAVVLGFAGGALIVF